MKLSKASIVAFFALLPLAGLPATASAHGRGHHKHQSLNSTGKVHKHHHHHHHGNKKSS